MTILMFKDGVLQAPNYTMEEGESLTVNDVKFYLTEDDDEDHFLLTLKAKKNDVQGRTFALSLFSEYTSSAYLITKHRNRDKEPLIWLDTDDTMYDDGYTYMFKFVEGTESFNLSFVINKEFSIIKNKFIMKFVEL